MAATNTPTTTPAPFLAPDESGPKALATERKGASFDVGRLTDTLNGGADVTAMKRDIVERMINDPVFGKDDRYFYTWEEHFANTLEKFKLIFKTTVLSGMTREMGEAMYDLVNVPMPISVHFGMFVPTIAGQGTEEQQEAWLMDAQVFNIIGCYAQTEFGHGSNVQGIQTTATYDVSTEEFVLNTPTITALKWWPGGLCVATHACVHARLIINGVDYGIHTFFVQLRDKETHELLPGIVAGSIGPKMGWNTVDNGYLGFSSVRIPRFNLLARYNKVEADGTYIKPPSDRLGYGTMVHVRSLIVQGASSKLAMACTIAIRYSAVRRQGRKKANGDEIQVIDYQMQQYRLFTLLATAYAFHFTGRFMRNLYERLQSGLDDNDLALLPEAHATSAGLKSITTTLTADGIEECRKACGGHGFSMFSGLVTLFQDYVPACTYEGDNIVMALQTARYLIKCRRSLMTESDGGASVGYLTSDLPTKCPAETIQGMMNPDLIVDSLALAARNWVIRADDELQALVGGGIDYNTAWDQTQISLVRASKAHCLYTIASNFALSLSILDDDVREPLTTLMCLFGLHHVEQASGELAMDGYLTNTQVGLIRAAIRSLLTKVRPDAVALVDAFEFPDVLLNSALGAYDGDVYGRMYEWAQRSRQNACDMPPGFIEHLRPVMDKSVVLRANL